MASLPWLRRCRISGAGTTTSGRISICRGGRRPRRGPGSIPMPSQSSRRFGSRRGRACCAGFICEGDGARKNSCPRRRSFGRGKRASADYGDEPNGSGVAAYGVTRGKAISTSPGIVRAIDRKNRRRARWFWAADRRTGHRKCCQFKPDPIWSLAYGFPRHDSSYSSRPTFS